MVNLPAVVPAFHRWIQARAVEGLLIDVADYKHVHHGPGIMLIGYDGDFSLDMAEGRPGLVYDRKRIHEGEPQDVLGTVFHRVLTGCKLLESDPTLSLTFQPDQVEIAFMDRLQVPNTSESFDHIRSDLEAVLGQVYGAGTVQLQWIDDDPRKSLTVRILVDKAGEIGTLIQNLENRKPSYV
jgi:hypothetical protein